MRVLYIKDKEEFIPLKTEFLETFDNILTSIESKNCTCIPCMRIRSMIILLNCIKAE